MIKKFSKYIILSIFSIVILTACGGKEEEVNINTNKEIKIGILMYRFDDPFIYSLKESIEKYSEIFYNIYTYDIKLNFADGKNQQEIQYEQVEKFIDEEYDVIAINLVDRNAAKQIIDKAKQANIPIIFFNRQPVEVDLARWNKLYYVGSKAEESGILQGEIISEYWLSHTEADKNNDGIMQYIILQGQQGHQDAIFRSQYCINEIKSQNIDIEELVKVSANWQMSEAKEKTKTILENFGEEIEFIISNNDAMALGAVEAMKDTDWINKDNLIPVVGVDAIKEAIIALGNGDIIGTVYNDNVTQGKAILDIAYYLAMNKKPEDNIKNIENGTYYWVPYKKMYIETRYKDIEKY